jgi:hypothetical protein
LVNDDLILNDDDEVQTISCVHCNYYQISGILSRKERGLGMTHTKFPGGGGSLRLAKLIHSLPHVPPSHHPGNSSKDLHLLCTPIVHYACGYYNSYCTYRVMRVLKVMEVKKLMTGQLRKMIL